MSVKQDRARYARRRKVLYGLQRKRCYLCAKRMYPGNRSTDDHVIPKSRGGRRDRNILLAHKKCNERKGDRPPHPCELLYAAAGYERMPA